MAWRLPRQERPTNGRRHGRYFPLLGNPSSLRRSRDTCAVCLRGSGIPPAGSASDFSARMDLGRPRGTTPLLRRLLHAHPVRRAHPRRPRPAPSHAGVLQRMPASGDAGGVRLRQPEFVPRKKRAGNLIDGFSAGCFQTRPRTHRGENGSIKTCGRQRGMI